MKIELFDRKLIINNYLLKSKTAQAGFTLIELAVTVVVIAILALALLNRVLFYQAEAERTAVDQTVGILRSALHLRIANLLARDKSAEIPKLLDQNPMEWLGEKPKNYLGVFYAPKTTNIAPGNWYYDKNSKKLIYLLNHGSDTRDSEPKQLIFKVKLVNNSDNSRRKADAVGADEVEGVILDQIN